MKAKMEHIKIVSWNILGMHAPDLESVQLKYPEISNWPSKFDQLLKKIISFDADIVCLQEIDSHIQQSFELSLQKYGFQLGSYVSKNSSGGALVLYKSTKFNRIYHNGIPLQINHKLGACACVILESKKTKQSIFVASLHLHWQNQKEQLELLVQSLKTPLAIPVIIAGDFNIPYVTMTHEIMPYLQKLHVIQHQKLLLFEHSSLTSQPPHHKNPDMWESLDHILFSDDITLDTTNSFVANPEQTYHNEKVATMITIKDSYKEPIPNKNLPSDHLPVIASFTFTSR